MGHKCRTSEVEITAHGFNDGRSHSLKSATTQDSSVFCDSIRLQNETWKAVRAPKVLGFWKIPITTTQQIE
jgi:hypothetical protein